MHQPIVDDDVGRPQDLEPLHGDQARVAGPSADEVHDPPFPVGLRSRACHRPADQVVDAPSRASHVAAANEFHHVRVDDAVPQLGARTGVGHARAQLTPQLSQQVAQPGLGRPDQLGDAVA